jgi:RNA polymerase sigma-70 factor (ECF subfamily)
LRELDEHTRFEQVILPHLGAAYRLARWLTRNDHDAEDVVQEAYLRAYKSFSSFRGQDGRGWLLAVVRNTCYTWLQKHRTHELTVPFDEQQHGAASEATNPERLYWQAAAGELLQEALEDLPVPFREAVVLRELEGCSYKEIAAIAGIPVGTVMSRLTRARARLQQAVAQRLGEEVGDGL